MYDIYAQKSNYPFKGVVYNQYRYFQEDTTLTIKGETFTYKKGDKNPFFKNFIDKVPQLKLNKNERLFGNLAYYKLYLILAIILQIRRG